MDTNQTESNTHALDNFEVRREIRRTLRPWLAGMAAANLAIAAVLSGYIHWQTQSAITKQRTASHNVQSEERIAAALYGATDPTLSPQDGGIVLAQQNQSGGDAAVFEALLRNTNEAIQAILNGEVPINSLSVRELSLIGQGGRVLARLAPTEAGNGSLEIRDSAGMPRVRLALTGNGDPRVNILDAQGVTRASLYTNDSNYAGLEIMDKDGKSRGVFYTNPETTAPILQIKDASGTARTVLYMNSAGYSGVELSDPEAKTRSSFLTSPDGSPSISFNQKDGVIRTSLYLNQEGQSGLILRDSNEKPRGQFFTSSENQEPRFLMQNNEGKTRVSISAEADGYASFAIHGSGEIEQAMLGIDHDDAPMLLMGDALGTPRAMLSVFEDGWAGLHLLDSIGYLRSSFSVEGENDIPSLSFYDDLELERLTLTTEPDGSGMLNFNDQDSRSRLVLRSVGDQNGAPLIFMNGPDAKPRIAMIVDPDGATGVGVLGEDGTRRIMMGTEADIDLPQLKLWDENGHQRVTLYINESDYSGLQLQDADGKNRAFFSTKPNGGRPSIELMDAQQKVKASLEYDD